MNLVGVNFGTSSDAATAALLLASEREAKMPERIASPRFPGDVSVSKTPCLFGEPSMQSHTATQEGKGHLLRCRHWSSFSMGLMTACN